jgi:hypothetical protein
MPTIFLSNCELAIKEASNHSTNDASLFAVLFHAAAE